MKVRLALLSSSSPFTPIFPTSLSGFSTCEKPKMGFVRFRASEEMTILAFCAGFFFTGFYTYTDTAFRAGHEGMSYALSSGLSTQY
jgi:hypothetical protein